MNFWRLVWSTAFAAVAFYLATICSVNPWITAGLVFVLILALTDSE